MKRSRLAARGAATLAALVWLGSTGSFAGEPPPDYEARKAAMEAHREQMKALSPFSIVAAPSGVEVKPAGSGDSPRSYRYWRAKADGSITPTELVEHYVAGLRELGWSFRPSIEEGVVTLRTGEYQDPEGASWHVLILAAPSLATAGRCIITIHLTQVP